MSISRKRAQDYAERVLARPRSDMPVTLRRGKTGVSLLYQGKALTRVHDSKVGRLQAQWVARVLGVELPDEGGEVTVSVPGGVVYRAVAVSTLDLRIPEARLLLEQHVQVADMQRTQAGNAAG